MLLALLGTPLHGMTSWHSVTLFGKQAFLKSTSLEFSMYIMYSKKVSKK
jgi:hypothetical protein